MIFRSRIQFGAKPRAAVTLGQTLLLLRWCALRLAIGLSVFGNRMLQVRPADTEGRILGL
jgi:hypothetical protein